MKVKLQNVLPEEIEKRSFEMIGQELGNAKLDPMEEPVIKRVIHTTADFDYLKNLKFSRDAVKIGIEALKNGAAIVTDTQMVRSGINKTVLGSLGGEALCFMADEDVAAAAKTNGTTRATASMDKAAELKRPIIFSVGNAPTALVRLYELIKEGKVKPELIIGVPVGFCQCGRVEGTDYGAGYSIYRSGRQKGREQCGGGNLQCAAVPVQT